MQNSEKTIIQVGNKVLTLEIKDFGSSEIAIEDLLQVQRNDIMLDMVTFPVIFNRISNIKAEIDNLLRETQFDTKAFEAQLYEKHKRAIINGGDKATEAAIDMAIKRDPEYKIKKMAEFSVQRQADIVDGLYWAAKSKDKKLDAISAKVSPEEFEKEIMERAMDKTINSVSIRSQQSIFNEVKKRF